MKLMHWLLPTDQTEKLHWPVFFNTITVFADLITQLLKWIMNNECEAVIYFQSDKNALISNNSDNSHNKNTYITGTLKWYLRTKEETETSFS